MGPNPPRREAGCAGVAARHATPADVQLAGRAWRHLGERVVQDVHASAVQLAADRNRAGVRWHVDDAVRGAGGGPLGRAVEVVELACEGAGQQLARGGRLQHVATGVQHAQRREGVPVLVQHVVDRHGRRQHGGDPPAPQLPLQVVGHEFGDGREHDDPGPVREGAPRLEVEGVERHAGHLAHPVGRGQRRQLRVPREVHQVAVLEDDRLGRARGAGGEQHARGVGRTRPRRSSTGGSGSASPLQAR